MKKYLMSVDVTQRKFLTDEEKKEANIIRIYDSEIEYLIARKNIARKSAILYDEKPYVL